ncbi:MAG: LysR family transcriptional regulator [Planctomycetota bacterium]
MEIRQLQYFVAVARTSSVSEAAATLGVSQPTVSQQLQKLEKDLGQPLFDRMPGGVQLTHAGAELVPHAERVLQELDDARRRVRDAGEEVAGPLTIAAIPTIAPFLLPQLVGDFCARNPDVEVEIREVVTSELLDDLLAGQVDVGILSSAEIKGPIHMATVGEEPLWVAVAEGHPFLARDEVALGQIDDERLLLLHDMHCLTGQIQQLCDGHGHAHIVARGSQLSTIMGMVARGFGATVVPDMLKRASGCDPAVRFLPFEGTPPRRPINVAWHLDRYRTRAARAFESLLRDRGLAGD